MKTIKSVSKKKISKEIAAREGFGSQIGKSKKKVVAKVQLKATSKVAPKKPAIIGKKSTKSASKYDERKFESARKKVFGLPNNY